MLTQSGQLYFFNFDLQDLSSPGSNSPSQNAQGGGECAFVKMIRLNRDYTRRQSSATSTQANAQQAQPMEMAAASGGNGSQTGLNFLSSTPPVATASVPFTTFAQPTPGSSLQPQQQD